MPGLSSEVKDIPFTLERREREQGHEESLKCQTDNLSSKYTRDGTSSYLNDNCLLKSALEEDLLCSGNDRLNHKRDIFDDLFSSVEASDLNQQNIVQQNNQKQL